VYLLPWPQNPPEVAEPVTVWSSGKATLASVSPLRLPPALTSTCAGAPAGKVNRPWPARCAVVSSVFTPPAVTV
jgi:hypothetical protein